MNKLITLDGLKEYNDSIPFKINNGNITPMDMGYLVNDVDKAVNFGNIFLSEPVLKKEKMDRSYCIIIGNHNSIDTVLETQTYVSKTIIIGSNTEASNSNQILLGDHNGKSISSDTIFSIGDGTGSIFAIGKNEICSLQFPTVKTLALNSREENDKTIYYLDIRNFSKKKNQVSKLTLAYSSAAGVLRNGQILAISYDHSNETWGSSLLNINVAGPSLNLINPCFTVEYINKKDYKIGSWSFTQDLNVGIINSWNTDISADTPIYAFLNYDFYKQEIYGTAMNFDGGNNILTSAREEISKYPPSLVIGGDGATSYWFISNYPTTELTNEVSCSYSAYDISY